VLSQLEEVFGVLRTAGFRPDAAVRSFYALLTYAFGFVLWEIPRGQAQPAGAYADAWSAAIDALDPVGHPNLRALRKELGTAASDEQFDYGLEALVRSLRTEQSMGRRQGRVEVDVLGETSWERQAWSAEATAGSLRSSPASMPPRPPSGGAALPVAPVDVVGKATPWSFRQRRKAPRRCVLSSPLRRPPAGRSLAQACRAATNAAAEAGSVLEVVP
jgi:hypothetical protein